MESAAVLRSFSCAVSRSSHLKTVLAKPSMLTMNNAAFSSQLSVCGENIIASRKGRGSLFVTCVKPCDSSLTAKSNGDLNGAVLSESQSGTQEKKSSSNATFPNVFEALLTEVCDETEIAELKLKVGAFEIHMKRKTDGPSIPADVVAQATAPSVPSKPANESTHMAPPPKPSTAKANPYANAFAEKAAKLASLEMLGSSGYVIVSSPDVGTFKRATMFRKKRKPPKKLPPPCKEGDVIKEGKAVCFIDQFGLDLPVKSNVDGEVVKFLCSDGEAVGYGDPLIAILPSSHGIK